MHLFFFFLFFSHTPAAVVVPGSTKWKSETEQAGTETEYDAEFGAVDVVGAGSEV